MVSNDRSGSKTARRMPRISRISQIPIVRTDECQGLIAGTCVKSSQGHIIPNRSLDTPCPFLIGEMRLSGILPASVRILFLGSMLHDTSGQSPQCLMTDLGLSKRGNRANKTSVRQRKASCHIINSKSNKQHTKILESDTIAFSPRIRQNFREASPAISRNPSTFKTKQNEKQIHPCSTHARSSTRRHPSPRSPRQRPERTRQNLGQNRYFPASRTHPR